MTTPRAVLDHIVSSISPASAAQAAGARARLAGKSGPRESLGQVEKLAVQLAGARHSPRPEVTRKLVVIVAADHGVADPGVDLGANAPTVVALRHIAGGEAAVNAAARSAGARLLLIDSGVRGGDRLDLGAGVLAMRVADGTADIRGGAAMTTVQALQSVQSGIAALLSLAEEGVDVLGLGAVSAGSHAVSGAMIAALGAAQADDFSDQDRDAIEQALSTSLPPGAAPLECLAAVGGPDIGLLAGIILGAAAINVPVVLDDHVTWSAALLAHRLAEPTCGYLIAAHGGGSPPHRKALEAIGIEPLFDLGLSHGEGTGAALALPFIDAAAGLLARPG